MKITVERDFFNRNTSIVAQDLLGCFLIREFRGKRYKCLITETEAYRGEYDLACHASRGKTPRTEIMYGEPGHAYVYMIYGMYFMLNVVTEQKDFPAAVLIRGIEASIEDSVGGTIGYPILKSKTDGPGKLTKFLQISKKLNGHDLTKGGKLWIEIPKTKTRFKIKKSPRIGVDYAKHCKDWKWNYKIVTSNQ